MLGTHKHYIFLAYYFSIRHIAHFKSLSMSNASVGHIYTEILPVVRLKTDVPRRPESLFAEPGGAGVTLLEDLRVSFRLPA